MDEVTYAPGLYFVNSQIGDRVGYRREINVSAIRMHLTRLWWFLIRKEYNIRTINKTKILYQEDVWDDYK